MGRRHPRGAVRAGLYTERKDAGVGTVYKFAHLKSVCNFRALYHKFHFFFLEKVSGVDGVSEGVGWGGQLGFARTVNAPPPGAVPATCPLVRGMRQSLERDAVTVFPQRHIIKHGRQP